MKKVVEAADMKIYDSIVIGGGQAGLSVAYFLRRHKADFLVLDDREKPGGAWLDTWDSLRLFSPTPYSSLSGWRMPQGPDTYPSKDEFIRYLEAYEQRYQFPILRPTNVLDVSKRGDLFKIQSDRGDFLCKTLVSATGTSQRPFIPDYPGRDVFQGRQLHSREYRNVGGMEGKKVIVVGGGNSGAQILAEVSKVASTKWVTLQEPQFLPDEIDGRYLFEAATEKYLVQSGKAAASSKPARKPSLSDIVVVESVKEARERDVLGSFRPFKSFHEGGVVWENGEKEDCEVVIWCTGFKADLDHLAGLELHEKGRIKTRHTRSLKEPNLWLVGYGGWTGFASATIYGVGKTARQTAKEIAEALQESS